MDKKDCKNCKYNEKCRDSLVSWIFLFVGIIAAVAMRLVGFYMDVNPFYAKIFWYIGVLFFIVFFIYRYKVSMNRLKTIKNENLVFKIKEGNLSEQDKETVTNMLCGLTSKKEMVNFSVIFILSGITLFLVLILDIMKMSK
ncbi:MAG: hypothetical protein KJ995_05085 [Candidatus Omnitrophica bacterium]|nr:hypothetical protein [Candidatus Omnitrophota bacterium]MBU1657407.1 hypothetical protein [Candidatus Omnitrophota bacterium]MBU1784541.1 hypothetical protein [Candidatus Omnitrophota bacterium]MBU1851762.1 hypothetical protein [Candidatus Omnitrophota bacterium]